MNEKENAIILEGKKYRVLTSEAFCDGCDLLGRDKCFGFCEAFEDYFSKLKNRYVYFKEVKE